jgi:hypothetical protein
MHTDGHYGELYGGTEDFLLRDRRLTPATAVEHTRECRIGFLILY